MHHFFADVTDVPDNELLTLVERALDSTQPRVWYWALMDYGAYLKAQSATRHAHQRSSHYAKQSSFAGSLRQLRGAVLKSLAHEGAQTLAQLTRLISDDRLQPVLSDLEKETMIYQRAGMYFLGAPKTSSRVDS